MTTIKSQSPVSAAPLYPRTPRPRDSQRSKVYRAESAVLSWKNPAGFDTIRAYTLDVYGSPRYAALVRPVLASGSQRGGGSPLPLLAVRYRANARGATAGHAAWGNLCVRFGRSNTLEWIAIHELAHIGIYLRRSKTELGHGPEWCGLYIELARQFLGRTVASTIARSFVQHGVKF